MQQTNQLKRDLKTRHLTMMALGGTIGTGLFLASGSVIHTAGPGGAILGYLVVAVLVYFVMTSLGEMATFSPVTGSFCEYSNKYVDRAFGFSMSWNYWLNWVLVVASEVIAAGLVMQFWFPTVSVWVWSSLFFVLILILNLVGVKIYGEAEYWLSFIKLSVVVIFVVVGALTIFGLASHHGPVGFKNITLGDAPFHAGWSGFVAAFLVIGYTFQGTELVGVAVGETDSPRKSISKAVKRIFWRILLFYILTITVISFLIPYTSDLLVNANSKVTQSPFTMVFASAGFKYAASIMNLVIITAIISTANASLYTASRVLWHIGNTKDGPCFLHKTNLKGIPVIGILMSALFAALCVVSSVVGSGAVFAWLLNVISLAGYVAWFGICLSYYRFRKAYMLQQKDLAALHYRAAWFPFAPLLAMALIIVIAVAQEVMVIVQHKASWSQFVATYIGLLVFFVLFFAYKFVKKTKFIKLQHCSLDAQN